MNRITVRYASDGKDGPFDKEEEIETETFFQIGPNEIGIDEPTFNKLLDLLGHLPNDNGFYNRRFEVADGGITLLGCRVIGGGGYHGENCRIQFLRMLGQP